jgi:transglutaminase-like putative cysteine protease
MSRFRQAVARWTLRRQGADLGEFELHRRRLYIVPTGLGFAYATMLLAMLVGGLNYGNNLALLLTFLLAAAGWVAMHQAHANLQGIVGHLQGTARTTDSTGPVDFHLALRIPDNRPRPDLEIDGPARAGLPQPRVVSLVPGQTVHVHWTQPTTPGLLRVRLATRYPLGLFRAWTWIHPPTPASAPTAATTPQRGDAGDIEQLTATPSGDGDVVSLRAWREGDLWQRIAWRASARLGRRVVMERAWQAPPEQTRPTALLRPPEAPPPANTALDPRTLKPALLALGMAGALLWGHVPWLVSGFLAACLLWRWLVTTRHWPLPPRWLKLLLALVAAMGVLLAFRTWNGLAAGSALLVTMAALKLTETRDRRDLGVLFFLAAFLTYSAVLTSGAPTTALLALGTLWLALAALVACARPPGSTGELPLLRQTGRTLLYGLPITALLFLFVPRIEGHFWSLPSEGRALSGLGDEMRPGDISELSLSDDPVMRVFFTDKLPPRSQRYWRGPVLHDFDGGTWRAARGTPYPKLSPLPQGQAISYRVLLEATQHRYLPLLERGLSWNLPQASQGWDLTVQAEQPVTSLLAYAATSYPAAVISGELPLSLRRRALQWPAGTNPQTLAWAAQLRSAYRDDRALLQAVLQHFSEPPFTYTLTPPQLDNTNAVDEFLFGTKQGFCGHYASALAAVARAAGIPARVVTGYQGGEWNRIGKYLLVRQADAHAWVEVWLRGQGWVRIDPTAAVAPERVEQGLDGALGADEPVPGRWSSRWQWLGEARSLVDAARTAWQQQFLQFDRTAQEQLAAKLGFGEDGLGSVVRALVALLGVAGAVLFVMVVRTGNWRRPSRWEREWRRACRRAAKAGLPRAAGEGELTYAERVAMAHPPLAAELRAAAQAYTAWRYLPKE